MSNELGHLLLLSSTALGFFLLFQIMYLSRFLFMSNVNIKAEDETVVVDVPVDYGKVHDASKEFQVAPENDPSEPSKVAPEKDPSKPTKKKKKQGQRGLSKKRIRFMT